jgi:hypothetical protein
MNVSAGLAHDGSLVVIASGWSHKVPKGQEPTSGNSDDPREVLTPWVCRSTDGGCSWEHTETVIVADEVPPLIPFGDIVRSPDGTLGTSVYTWPGDRKCDACVLRSRDDGRTWSELVVIGAEDYNETDLLCLDGRQWLAACRTAKDAHLELFASQDAGSSWTRKGPLTLPDQHPAHLLQLADGRILLTYGIRNRGLLGVGARLSADGGDTWETPRLLVDLENAKDGGYPSSVQLPDGTIVTAYYCSGVQAHGRYHMGVLRWSAE